jgi:hypothetical protein
MGARSDALKTLLNKSAIVDAESHLIVCNLIADVDAEAQDAMLAVDEEPGRFGTHVR